MLAQCQTTSASSRLRNPSMCCTKMPLLWTNFGPPLAGLAHPSLWRRPVLGGAVRAQSQALGENVLPWQPARGTTPLRRATSPGRVFYRPVARPLPFYAQSMKMFRRRSAYRAPHRAPRRTRARARKTTARHQATRGAYSTSRGDFRCWNSRSRCSEGVAAVLFSPGCVLGTQNTPPSWITSRSHPRNWGPWPGWDALDLTRIYTTRLRWRQSQTWFCTMPIFFATAG